MEGFGRESVARALIAQSDGLGPRLIQGLIEACGGRVERLFEQPDEALALDVDGIGSTRIEKLHENLQRWDLEAARDRLKERDIGVLSAADETYPEHLAEIYDPPPALFYRGRTERLQSACVGIVGTRRATNAGREIARELARDLAGFGVCVVSGLAAGIDGAAHRGGLENGQRTVAVLGTGLDRTYPARHRDLQQQIGREGLLVTEYPPGTDPDRNHFPERNRIISGLSKAVIVVQAGQRSGALITADFALEQGREVYAVPGEVDHPQHRGCHMLIKQGAGLVESAEDVIDYLQLEGDFTPPERVVHLEPSTLDLLEQLQSKPIHLDQLVERTGMDVGECSRRLLELESRNLILGLPGQRYQRSRDTRHLEIVVETSDDESLDRS